jgi:hypothetical protein
MVVTKVVATSSGPYCSIRSNYPLPHKQKAINPLRLFPSGIGLSGVVYTQTFLNNARCLGIIRHVMLALSTPSANMYETLPQYCEEFISLLYSIPTYYCTFTQGRFFNSTPIVHTDAPCGHVHIKTFMKGYHDLHMTIPYP